MVPLRVLSRTNLADTSRRSAPNRRSFNALQPLCRSWRSFSHGLPLFSIACSLFLQNTWGGGIPTRSLDRRLESKDSSGGEATTGQPCGCTSAPRLCFHRHMRHVAPLSPLASVDCAYFPSPRGCTADAQSAFPGVQMRSQPAFRSSLATPCAPLLP